MSGWEIAVGWVSGHEVFAIADPGPVLTPRSVLASRTAELLRAGPVYIAFSGGRDSSLLLALLAAVAREQDLPLPRPLILDHKAATDAEERDWQDRVLEHLSLSAERISVDGEVDVVGPKAMEVLRHRGVCWPPALTSYTPLYAPVAATGGVLVTGEGGDEMLGSRRITPVSRAVRWRRPPRGKRLQECALALAPARARAVLLRRISGDPIAQGLPWLRAEHRRRVWRDMLTDLAAEPLGHAAGTYELATRRVLRLGLRHIGLLAAEHGVRLVHPLVEPPFVRALMLEGGRLGTAWLSRTEKMRQLVGDLLPEEVITRQSKATFNSALFNRHARAFVADWDGSGVDDNLVDIAALRAEWSTPTPNAGSFALLQQARLAADAA